MTESDYRDCCWCFCNRKENKCYADLSERGALPDAIEDVELEEVCEKKVEVGVVEVEDVVDVMESGRGSSSARQSSVLNASDTQY
jgi:hypothetical protein